MVWSLEKSLVRRGVFLSSEVTTDRNKSFVRARMTAKLFNNMVVKPELGINYETVPDTVMNGPHLLCINRTGVSVQGKCWANISMSLIHHYLSGNLKLNQ